MLPTVLLIKRTCMHMYLMFILSVLQTIFSEGSPHDVSTSSLVLVVSVRPCVRAYGIMWTVI